MVTSQQPATGGRFNFSVSALTFLFFMWGFITALNDILIPHLKGVFNLTYTQAMLIQFCFFGAYFLVSVPAGRLVKAVGYQKGLVAGLVTASAGCLLFIPAAKTETYLLFLAALFVLASGITILQVAANPLVTILGSPETASSRLTMTQAFNSLGTTVAPIVGGILLFSASGEDATSASDVIVPYVGLALTLFGLAMLFLKLPMANAVKLQEETAITSDEKPLSSYPHLVLGAVAIFLYVGAEVSIGSFLVNFLGEKHIADMPESVAAHYIAYYWGGAMVGRFVGAALMQKIRPGLLLGFNSVVAMVLIAVAVSSKGAVAMWAILLVGLFNSIMFPTIFSLAVKGLGGNTSKGSGLLCLAIVGGAIVPLMQGVLADAFTLQVSFLLPLVCYAFIAFYGVKGSSPKVDSASGANPQGQEAKV